MPDIIRVIKYGVNDYELQVRAANAWRHLYIEFTAAGSGGLSRYEKLSFEDDTTDRTVVKNYAKFDRRNDGPHWNDVKSKPSILYTSGGTMTGNISFNMHGTNRTPFKIYGGDQYGQGISVGVGLLLVEYTVYHDPQVPAFIPLNCSIGLFEFFIYI